MPELLFYCPSLMEKNRSSIKLWVKQWKMENPRILSSEFLEKGNVRGKKPWSVLYYSGSIYYQYQKDHCNCLHSDTPKICSPAFELSKDSKNIFLIRKPCLIARWKHPIFWKPFFFFWKKGGKGSHNASIHNNSPLSPSMREYK